MPLVRLQNGPSQRPSIKDAAHILFQASTHPDTTALLNTLRAHYSDPSLTAIDRHTGVNDTRKAVLVSSKQSITIAFEGSTDNELYKNVWTMAKGPNWWDIPYPVYDVNGHRVHSFYRDMWHGMRAATFEALKKAVQEMAKKGKLPKRLVVTGFSMGGGVSTMAFIEILQHIRSTYGSASPSPQDWATDSNLGNLISHLTFAAVGAGDQGFHTVLNRLYEDYQMPAWDFWNHKDNTGHWHDFAFRSWRGHRYILPDAVVRYCEADFGQHAHGIRGYRKAAEWIEGNGTDQVKSAYSY